jgi:hypothetical protein
MISSRLFRALSLVNGPVTEGKQREVKTRESERAIFKMNLQPSIDEARTVLSAFATQTGVAAIISAFLFFEMPGEVEEATILSLRKQLIAIMSDKRNDNIRADNGISLSDAAQLALYALAIYRPVNSEGDFVDGAPILPSDLMVTTDGYQFNLHSLIEFHNTRPYQGTAPLKELHNKKYLLNPYTMGKIPERDVDVLQFIADKNNIKIKDFRQQISAPAATSDSKSASRALRSGTYLPGHRFSSDILMDLSASDLLLGRLPLLRRINSSGIAFDGYGLPSSSWRGGDSLALHEEGLFAAGSTSFVTRSEGLFSSEPDVKAVDSKSAAAPVRASTFLSAAEQAMLGPEKTRLFDRPSVRTAVYHGWIMISQMAAMDAHRLDVLFSPMSTAGLDLLRDEIITVDQINALFPILFVSLCAQPRLAALVRNGVFTMEQVNQISIYKDILMTRHPEILAPLEEGRITAAQFIEMSNAEVRALYQPAATVSSSMRHTG